MGVGAGIGERDGSGVPAIGVGSIGAIGGDFDGRTLFGDNGDDAERFADGVGFGKQRHDAVGEGIGDDIPILGRAVKQEIADAPADEERFVAVLAEGHQNLAGGGRDGVGKLQARKSA